MLINSSEEHVGDSEFPYNPLSVNIAHVLVVLTSSGLLFSLFLILVVMPSSVVEMMED